jgi:formylglycine-generating enzyme
MSGNVWEWTSDWFAPYRESAGTAVDPKGPADGSEKVIRGGSWMCSTNYCTGYRAGARQKSPRDSGLNNLGFRCVRTVTP